MIRIAIVDDIIEICSSLERILLHYAEKIDEKIEVEPYTSSETFFSALDNNETFDLIYLDIEIDNKTGIDIANHIRSVMDDELQQIVYISGKPEYSIKLHETHPLDFIIKPIKQESVEKIMNRYMKISGRFTDNFTYNIGTDRYKIKMKEILYFNVSNHTTEMHTKNNVISIYGTLKALEKELKRYGFLRIHRKILVNSLHIKAYHYENVTLYNGESLEIGKTYHNDVTSFKLESFRED